MATRTPLLLFAPIWTLRLPRIAPVVTPMSNLLLMSAMNGPSLKKSEKR